MVKSLTKNTFESMQNYWTYDQIIFTGGCGGQGILNKDPTVWLGGARSPQKYVCKYIKIVLSPNHLPMIYDSATKLFSNGNFPNVLYGEKYTDIPYND